MLGADVNIFFAFGAGFLSFISPCVLPLYPAFISYITGMSLDELGDKNKGMNKAGMLHTLFFLLGFSIVFVILGFSTSFIGAIFLQYQDLIRQLGAIFIIIFGLMTIGVFKPEFLMKEKKLQFKNRPAGYLGTALIGLAFSAGWQPCMGPIIGAIIYLAATNPASSMLYMMLYVLGFAIPFFFLSFFITRIGWIRRHSMTITKVGGYLMIAFGILLFFNGMVYLTSLLSPIFGDFQGF